MLAEQFFHRTASLNALEKVQQGPAGSATHKALKLQCGSIFVLAPSPRKNVQLPDILTNKIKG
jgi:hypothetical protein